ncbi:E3 ubiquitin-protein ligase rnf13 [Chytridiales sp. JEL 0842]|nr:E3 ubiquitin-protein ligase rnf13 [Chytridiales sp. JEL 0842]
MQCLLLSECNLRHSKFRLKVVVKTCITSYLKTTAAFNALFLFLVLLTWLHTLSTYILQRRHPRVEDYLLEGPGLPWVMGVAGVVIVGKVVAFVFGNVAVWGAKVCQAGAPGVYGIAVKHLYWWYAHVALFLVIGVVLLGVSVAKSKMWEEKKRRQRHEKDVRKWTRVFVFEPSFANEDPLRGDIEEAGGKVKDVEGGFLVSSGDAESEEAKQTATTTETARATTFQSLIFSRLHLSSASKASRASKPRRTTSTSTPAPPTTLSKHDRVKLQRFVTRLLRFRSSSLPTQSTTHFQSTCSICLEDFTGGSILRELQCLHSFHRECVDVYLRGGSRYSSSSGGGGGGWDSERKPVCPVCGRRVFCEE